MFYGLNISRKVLQNLRLEQLRNKFPTLPVPTGVLLCQQESFTAPSPEPVESSP
jgi:hypothetical protein